MSGNLHSTLARLDAGLAADGYSGDHPLRAAVAEAVAQAGEQRGAASALFLHLADCAAELADSINLAIDGHPCVLPAAHVYALTIGGTADAARIAYGDYVSCGDMADWVVHPTTAGHLDCMSRMAKP